MSEAIVDVKGLTVEFSGPPPVRAVGGVDLTLAPGEVLALLGESGSGKSVTLRALMRLLPKRAAIGGTIRVDGRDVRAMRAAELSAYRGFWSITQGGAEGLYIDDLVGNFTPGKEADFVVLDCNGGPPALAWRQSLIAEDGKPPTLEQAADLLFGLMMVGDDRAIEQTWAMGRQVYLRRGSN